MVTQERLKELLEYNPLDGVFTWKVNRRRTLAGDWAGSRTKSGYITIGIDYKMYLAHRLVWLYVHGSFPTKSIDHINNVKEDNTLSNLRLSL